MLEGGFACGRGGGAGAAGVPISLAGRLVTNPDLAGRLATGC